MKSTSLLCVLMVKFGKKNTIATHEFLEQRNTEFMAVNHNVIGLVMCVLKKLCARTEMFVGLDMGWNDAVSFYNCVIVIRYLSLCLLIRPHLLMLFVRSIESELCCLILFCIG